MHVVGRNFDTKPTAEKAAPAPKVEAAASVEKAEEKKPAAPKKSTKTNTKFDI